MSRVKSCVEDGRNIEISSVRDKPCVRKVQADFASEASTGPFSFAVTTESLPGIDLRKSGTFLVIFFQVENR